MRRISVRGLGMTVLLVMVAASVAGCASGSLNNGWPTEVDKTHRAVVKTSAFDGQDRDQDSDVVRLRAYWDALRHAAGADNLETQFIGCVECGSFDTRFPPDQLTFIFFQEHKRNREVFVRAFERVQSSSLGHFGFTLTFVNQASPVSACTKPVPTCYPMPSCPRTSYCDANRNVSGCQECPP